VFVYIFLKMKLFSVYLFNCAKICFKIYCDMMPEMQNSGPKIEVVIARQQPSRYVSMAIELHSNGHVPIVAHVGGSHTCNKRRTMGSSVFHAVSADAV
jgi:hypothetical protein